MAWRLNIIKRAAIYLKTSNNFGFSFQRNIQTNNRNTLCQVNTAKAIAIGNDGVDFTSAIKDFKRNGMAILPLKIGPSFVESSKELCFSAWKDALRRAEIVRGHEMKVGMEFGFQELVARAPGRYDMHWKVNGEKHFLDEENVLSKFMPFVHNILGNLII